jgi:hypothetical protein
VNFIIKRISSRRVSWASFDLYWWPIFLCVLVFSFLIGFLIFFLKKLLSAVIYRMIQVKR